MTSLAHHDRSQIWTCNNNNQASKKYFCDHLSTTLAWEYFFALNLSIVSVKHKSCIMRKVFSINLLVRQCLFLLLSWYIKYVYIYIYIVQLLLILYVWYLYKFIQIKFNGVILLAVNHLVGSIWLSKTLRFWKNQDCAINDSSIS